jgi:hypothetical protein
MARILTSTAALALAATMTWNSPAAAQMTKAAAEGAKPPTGIAAPAAPAAPEAPSAGRTLREDLGLLGKDGTDVPLVEDRLLAAGLGAIAGIVLVNFAMGGTAALPIMAETMPVMGGGGITAVSHRTGAVAVSRVYAVSSAVIGGWAGDYLYRRAQAGRLAVVPKPVADRVAPQ